MLCATPEEIYPIGIFEFLGYLDTKKLTTKVTCIHPKTHTSYLQDVNLLDFATTHLKLRNDGEDVMNTKNRVAIVEFRRYIVDTNEAWVEGKLKKYTCKLAFLFKDPMDLITKVMLSHTRNISTITNPKLRVLVALTDEFQGVAKYNSARFMIAHWAEAAKCMKAKENNPYVFQLRQKKIHFGSWLSFALGSTFKDLICNPCLEPRKTGIFKKKVDCSEITVHLALVKEGEE